jgi:hypothetical protein
MSAVSQLCIWGSHYGGYVPVIGIFTGLADITAKPILSTAQANCACAVYLRQKSIVRSLVGMVPVVGTLALMALDCHENRVIRQYRLGSTFPEPIPIQDLSHLFSRLRSLLYLKDCQRVHELLRGLQIIDIHLLPAEFSDRINELDMHALFSLVPDALASLDMLQRLITADPPRLIGAPPPPPPPPITPSSLSGAPGPLSSLSIPLAKSDWSLCDD